MIKKEIKSRFIKNSFWNFTSAVISRFGALIFIIILARFLLPERYGVYSLALSIAMIFFTMTDLGVTQAFVKYASSSIKKKKEEISSYYQYLFKLKLILALSFSILLFLLAFPLVFYVFKNPDLLLPLLAASVYIFVSSFEGFYYSMFYVLEKSEYISLREVLNQVLRIVFALIIFFFVSSYYQVLGIFISFILTSFLLLLFSLFYIKRLFPRLYIHSNKKINKTQVLKFVGYLSIAFISSAFFSYIDAIMLGLFVVAEYIGYYRAAFSFVFGVVGLIGAFTPILLPFFSKLKKQGLDSVLNSLFKYALIIIVPSIFGLIVLGKYFIRFFYGYEYLPATMPLYVLAPLILPVIGVSILLSLFSAEEKPEIFAKLIVFTTLLNILLNYVLIKYLIKISELWATVGVSIATLISWSVYFLLAVYFTKKDFNITLKFRHMLKPLFASLIMSAVLLYLLSFIKDMNAILGLGGIILGIITYFIVLFLIGGLKREDLNLIRLLIKR